MIETRPEDRPLFERLNNPIRGVVYKKHKTLGFRASYIDMQMIDFLCEHYDLDKSQVMRLAITNLYNKAIEEK